MHQVFCRDYRGAASLPMILGIVSLIIMFGFSAFWLARSESTDSLINKASNDAYFVADSGRRVAERCFQLYMVGSVKQKIQSPGEIENVSGIANSTDPVKFIVLGGLAGVAGSNPTVAKYRVDLNGGADTSNLVVSDGTPIWNTVGPDRVFDAEIVVEKHDNPTETDQYWAFPLRFKITVVGRAPLLRDRKSQLTTMGRGTVTLFVNKMKKRSYADYMEFTEEYVSRHGTPTMKPRDTYYGPVHTVGRYRFMGNPGTLFQTSVYTSMSDALFWDTTKNAWGESNKEFYPPDAKSVNGYVVYPQFGEGYFRSVSVELLPDTHPNFEADVLAGRVEPGSTVGIYAPVDNTTMAVIKGGIYIVGSCDISLVRDGTRQIYRFTHYNDSGGVEGQSEIITDYDAVAATTSVQLPGEAAATSYSGVLDVDFDAANGYQNAIYIRGQVKSLQGELARNTMLSIYASGRLGSNDDIIITGDLQYELEPTATDPNPPNILGLMAESGDVAIACSTTDINIDAHIMTFLGELYCTNWSGAMKGNLNLFGTVASHRAGVIGTQTQGYAKNYKWDTRATFAPPPLYMTYKSLYTVIMERPDTGQSTWRVVWSNENL